MVLLRYGELIETVSLDPTIKIKNSNVYVNVLLGPVAEAGYYSTNLYEIKKMALKYHTLFLCLYFRSLET